MNDKKMKTKYEQLTIPLEGVDSEHCANIVYKGLQKLEGVRELRVEVNNKRVLVSTDRTDLLPVAITTIRELGYDVPAIHRKFPELKMTCASCALSVESMLKSVEGVLEASVNYADGSVLVEYVPFIADPADMKAAVQSIGYDLWIDDAVDEEEALQQLEAERFRKLKQRTI